MIKILYIPEGTYLYFDYGKQTYNCKTIDFMKSDIAEFYNYNKIFHTPKSILEDVINDAQRYYYGWEAFLDSTGKNKITFRGHYIEEFEIIKDD